MAYFRYYIQRFGVTGKIPPILHALFEGLLFTVATMRTPASNYMNPSILWNRTKL